MPSNIELQDAIEQCGEEILESIIDAITPFSDTPLARRMIDELTETPDTNLFLQFRLAPSIVCRSEIELYSIYMPRFGIRIELGGQEGFGFLTFRRSKLLQKALEAAYADDTTILTKLRVAENSRYGKLADSVIRIPALDPADLTHSPKTIRFWNVAQAELLKHYGGHPGERGTPFVTHSDSSGGMCAQACIFMLEMYHIDSLKQINGIADISYLAATTSLRSKDTLSIPLKGLTAQSVYDYIKHHFTNHCRLMLSVHNLPNRYVDNQNKGTFGHLVSTFSADLGNDPALNERVLQRIEVEAYARSLIPQIALVDLGLLYDDKAQPPPRLPEEPGKKRPHAILVVGTRYGFDPETGGLKEQLVLNDPATGPLRLLDTRHSLVDCARYHDHDRPDSGNHTGPPAFESLAILPQGMTRHLAPKQIDSIPGQLVRIKPVKHFTTGILEDLQRNLNLKQEADALQKLILIAIQFPTDDEMQVTYRNMQYTLAASILAKLKINLLKTGKKTILKDLCSDIHKQLQYVKAQLEIPVDQPQQWYWLVCLPHLRKQHIEVRLRIYDASGSKVIYKQQIIEALDAREFSLSLK